MTRAQGRRLALALEQAGAYVANKRPVFFGNTGSAGSSVAVSVGVRVAAEHNAELCSISLTEYFPFRAPTPNSP